MDLLQIPTIHQCYSDLAAIESLPYQPGYLAGDLAFAEGQVVKQWGLEHPVHSSKCAALWVLRMIAGGATSMHAHPRTASAVVVVTGDVSVAFLRNSRRLKRGQGLIIARGVWHSLQAHAPSVVVEALYPNRRGDLLRLTPAGIPQKAKGVAAHNYLCGAQLQAPDAIAAWLRFEESTQASRLAYGCLWSIGPLRFHRQQVQPQCGRLLLSTTASDLVMLSDATDQRLETIDPDMSMFSLGFGRFE